MKKKLEEKEKKKRFAKRRGTQRPQAIGNFPRNDARNTNNTNAAKETT